MTPLKDKQRVAAIFVAFLGVLGLTAPTDETEKEEREVSVIARRKEGHGPRKDLCALH